MSRVNLTLDAVTDEKLTRYAKSKGTKKAAAARSLLLEALEQREAAKRRRGLALAYVSGRADARELLKDLETAQLEGLGREGA